jgi:hypothetical protein
VVGRGDRRGVWVGVGGVGVVGVSGVVGIVVEVGVVFDVVVESGVGASGGREEVVRRPEDLGGAAADDGGLEVRVVHECSQALEGFVLEGAGEGLEVGGCGRVFGVHAVFVPRGGRRSRATAAGVRGALTGRCQWRSARRGARSEEREARGKALGIRH